MSAPPMKFAAALVIAVAACGPRAAPADPGGGGTGSTATDDRAADPDSPDDDPSTPAPEGCVEWNDDGECTETAVDEGMYPAEVCLDWDAAGECIQYEGRD